MLPVRAFSGVKLLVLKLAGSCSCYSTVGFMSILILDGVNSITPVEVVGLV